MGASISFSGEERDRLLVGGRLGGIISCEGVEAAKRGGWRGSYGPNVIC